MVKIIDAILNINPNAKVTIQGNDFDQITWHDGTTPISKADIESKIAELPTLEQTAVAKKTSGKQKLKDLGLDDDEIKALIGE